METPLLNPKRLNSKYLLKDFKAREISEYPYIVKIKNLISDEEIKELLSNARGKFERSNLVVDGELVYNQTRTSSTAYLFKDGMPDKYSRPIERLVKRICYLGNCDRSQIEMMAVRYRQGQKFDAHVDYFEDHELGVLDDGGQRIFTFFCYLNTLHEGDGGETEFTQLGIKSKPRKGDAVFWINQDFKTGKMIPETEHRGNPVLKKDVTKYGLNIWIRSNSFY